MAEIETLFLSVDFKTKAINPKNVLSESFGGALQKFSSLKFVDLPT